MSSLPLLLRYVICLLLYVPSLPSRKHVLETRRGGASSLFAATIKAQHRIDDLGKKLTAT
jgi:hypothetical protein